MKKEKVEMIDITPEWVNLHPLFSSWIDSGTKSQKDLVKSELLKLCKLADSVNKENK